MCVTLFVTHSRKEVLSKEDKMARLLISNDIKETNTTHTNKDKIRNTFSEDLVNYAELSLELLATHEMSSSSFLPQMKVSFPFSSK